MARRIFIAALFFFLAIIQVSVFPNFFNSHRIPDLVLLVLIFFAARRGFSNVWRMAALAGLILDLFSFFPIGVNMVSFLATILFVDFLASSFFIAQSTWKFPLLVMMVIVGTLINDLVIAGLIKAVMIFESTENSGFPLIGGDIWLKIVSNLTVFILIYWPVKKIESMRDVYMYDPKRSVRHS